MLLWQQLSYPMFQKVDQLFMACWMGNSHLEGTSISGVVIEKYRAVIKDKEVVN
jgi:hypothetical protein